MPKTVCLSNCTALSPLANAFTRKGWTIKLFNRNQDISSCNLYIIWAGSRLSYRERIKKYRAAGATVLFAELGWLPQHSGIYLDPEGCGLASTFTGMDLSTPLTEEESAWLDERLAEYKNAMHTTGLRIPNQPEPFCLVPLQAERDINITDWSDLRKMSQFMKLAASISCMNIIIKPHPRYPLPQGNEAMLHLQKIINARVTILPSGYALKPLIEKATMILTINSCVGIEGIAWGKKVITIGKSFYDRHELVNPFGQTLVTWKNIHDETSESYPVAVRKMMKGKKIQVQQDPKPKLDTEMLNRFAAHVHAFPLQGQYPNSEMQEYRRRFLFKLFERQLPPHEFESDDIIDRIMSGDFKRKWKTAP